MALQTRLHSNRANHVPKMLLGIAEDVLRHCLSQGIVRVIMDRNVSHGDAPLLSAGDRVVSRSTCSSTASMTAFCPRRYRASQTPACVTRWMSAVILWKQGIVIVSRHTHCRAAAA